jgi:hypothetical protein
MSLPSEQEVKMCIGLLEPWRIAGSRGREIASKHRQLGSSYINEQGQYMTRVQEIFGTPTVESWQSVHVELGCRG